jgi:predicted nucleic acid-binding protein
MTNQRDDTTRSTRRRHIVGPMRSCLLPPHCRLSVSLALFLEYESVLDRDELMARSPLSRRERDAVFDALLSGAREIEVYYARRPNLRDEGDNFVVETAIAAGVVPIVTHNTRDFAAAQLKFEGLEIFTPAQRLKRKGVN